VAILSTQPGPVVCLVVEAVFLSMWRQAQGADGLLLVTIRGCLLMEEI